MPRIFAAGLAVLALSFITACDSGGDNHGHGHGGQDHSALAEVSKAICVLSPTGHEELPSVTGTITFIQTKTGILVEADLSGLKPNSKHAFHIHQWGDISAADGTAAGGHYDPQGVDRHALPNIHAHGDEAHALILGHAGGLGNLEADDQGNVSYTMSYENLTLTGTNALLGRAVIIHLDEDTGDDFSLDTSARVAQGVIGVANPE